jgi:tetratricopeptide (TPR) repeat protein
LTDCDDTDHGDSAEGDSASESSFSDSFDNDVLCLRDFSLMSISVDRCTFEMHSLVQLAVRTWLMANGKLDWWKEQYVHCLYMDFPIGDFQNWAKCQTLFPHVRSAVAQRPEGQESLKEWTSLLTKAAQYALRRGNVADAENMSRKAMKVNKSLFGSESLEFISGMVIVSQVCGHRDRWDDAEKLLVQVMETCKKVFGTESQHTLSSMVNLASTYKSQGRWEKAEELEQQVMDTRKIVLGRDHVDTLASMTSLAWTYNKQGRFKEARKLDMQVATTRNKMLDSRHALSTITTGVFTITEG